MASKFVEDTVDAYLEANWPHIATCPIIGENEPQEAPVQDDPAVVKAFLLVQYPVSNTEKPSINERTYQEEGGVRIVINLERGAGDALMREYGETITELFRNVWIGDIEFLVPSEPFTDDRSDEGVYFTGAMVCPYRYVYTP
jgi:hypothetical protein